MAECGYTPGQVAELTLDEVNDLNAYWTVHPPRGVGVEILARLWGWKPPPAPAPKISYAEAAAKDADMYRSLSRWFPRAKTGGKL